MKRILAILAAALLLAGCSKGESSSQAETTAPDNTTKNAPHNESLISENETQYYTPEDYIKPEPVTELICDKYQDKPHLRVMIGKNHGYSLDLLNSFNDKLD